jgi:hypothetical protein
LRVRGCPGTPRIADEPQDGFFLLHRPLPGEEGIIDAPDKAFDAGRRRRTVHQLQKRLAGTPPFSDKVLHR